MAVGTASGNSASTIHWITYSTATASTQLCQRSSYMSATMRMQTQTNSAVANTVTSSRKIARCRVVGNMLNSRNPMMARRTSQLVIDGKTGALDGDRAACTVYPVG